jgi:hypothetical protein
LRKASLRRPRAAADHQLPYVEPSWNTEAGLYMGDSPNGYSVARDNRSDHNGLGIFMRDSTHLTATDNKSWGNCVGILALNPGGGAPGDLPAGNYRITDNQVWANNMSCPSSSGLPASGIGIALAGVHDTLVLDNKVSGIVTATASVAHGGIVIISTKSTTGADPTHNTVLDNKVSGIVTATASVAHGGIVIISTKSTTGADPTHNTVLDNTAHGNKPSDIFWDGTGFGNKVRHNN